MVPAVHSFEKEWMNKSCRVKTHCQHRSFSCFVRDGHFERPLNRAKSCTLQVRAPLWLVIFEHGLLKGCTVYSACLNLFCEEGAALRILTRVRL